MDDRLHRALVALFVEALMNSRARDAARREGDGRDSGDRDVKPENVALRAPRAKHAR